MILRVFLVGVVLATLALVGVALSSNRANKSTVIKACTDIYTPIRGNLNDHDFNDVLRACEANR